MAVGGHTVRTQFWTWDGMACDYSILSVLLRHTEVDAYGIESNGLGCLYAKYACVGHVKRS
jgi:hypothetical protein